MMKKNPSIRKSTNKKGRKTLKAKSKAALPKNIPESSSPVCYSGREKFREGFEDQISGKSSDSGK
jgi:hypothetical protein